jgi:hypothetical protein
MLEGFFSWAYLDTVTTCLNESSLSNINGKKYLATRNGPLTLTSQTPHHFSGSLSWIMAMSIKPALLTMTSSLPTTLLTSAAASETETGSVTSSFNCRIWGSGLPASRAAFLISFEMASSDERAPRIMEEAPAWAKLVAIARPVPLLAPVMRMLLPERFWAMGEMVG